VTRGDKQKQKGKI